MYLRREVAELDKQGVQFKVIGDRQKLDTDIVTLIKEAEQQTAENDQLVLTIALSYGSRAEITRAVRRIADEAADGRLRPDEISESLVHDHLYTADIPDPDLLIRTSGEQRISNFLMWQSAYSEMYLTTTLWPDLGDEELTKVIEAFGSRRRRYGALNPEDQNLGPQSPRV